MVEDVLKDSEHIERRLQPKHCVVNKDINKIRWITLAHSNAEDEIEKFVKDRTLP